MTFMWPSLSTTRRVQERTWANRWCGTWSIESTRPSNPLWQAEVELIASRDLATKSGGLEEIEFEQLPDELRRFDKLQTLVVRATTHGFEIKCREYDAYVRRWGGLQRQSVRQASFLHERCFQLLLDVFAPLATITPRKDDPQTVELLFRGVNLPRRTEEDLFVEPGQVMQPLLRRTNRAGELVGGGAPPVPWTYVTAAEPTDEGWLARIDSGLRRPFGGRRRGRVQTLAFTLRPTSEPTDVRFYARHRREEGLAGYEVYRRAPSDDESTLLGVTDARGALTLPAQREGVVTLFLRSDGQLLAKAPVVPGAARLVEVPIADDPARLRAARPINGHSRTIDRSSRPARNPDGPGACRTGRGRPSKLPKSLLTSWGVYRAGRYSIRKSPQQNAAFRRKIWRTRKSKPKSKRCSPTPGICWGASSILGP